jgi:hypothetical protein
MSGRWRRGCARARQGGCCPTAPGKPLDHARDQKRGRHGPNKIRRPPFSSALLGGPRPRVAAAADPGRGRTRRRPSASWGLIVEGWLQVRNLLHQRPDRWPGLSGGPPRPVVPGLAVVGKRLGTFGVPGSLTFLATKVVGHGRAQRLAALLAAGGVVSHRRAVPQSVRPPPSVPIRNASRQPSTNSGSKTIRRHASQK